MKVEYLCVNRLMGRSDNVFEHYDGKRICTYALTRSFIINYILKKIKGSFETTIISSFDYDAFAYDKNYMHIIENLAKRRQSNDKYITQR